MSKAKPKIYFDTSVPSNYFDTESARQTALTRLFWEDYLKHFKILISEVTLQEIRQTKQLEKRNKVLQLVKRFSVLEVTDEVENLAENYVKVRLVPRSSAVDALHIACSTYYRIDFLVSWNIRHMANPNQRKKLTDYNVASGLFVPQLTTPEELINTYAENKSTT